MNKKEEIAKIYENKITLPQAAKLFGVSYNTLRKALEAADAPKPISSIGTKYYNVEKLFEFIKTK